MFVRVCRQLAKTGRTLASQSSRSARQRICRARPCLDVLEDRFLPSIFTVTSALDIAAVGTLRWAIGQANSSPGSTIMFNIGGGTQTIQVGSATATPLPALTVPTILSAAPPGAHPDQMVVIDGSKAGSSATGLDLKEGNTVINGAQHLAIVHFSGDGVLLETTGGDTVAGSFLGTDNLSMSGEGNRTGVHILSTSNNTVGGTTPSARNVISGNTSEGVRIDRDTTLVDAVGNTVEGNFIGTNVAGTQGLGNATAGVLVLSVDNNTIGGAAPEARNLISANYQENVRIEALGVRLPDGNVVQGDYIGTDVTGTVGLGSALGLTIEGVNLDGATNSKILGNLISGGQSYGIGVSGTGNLIQGNRIGTTADGLHALGNDAGIYIESATNTTIGGATSSVANVISANRSRLLAGIEVIDASSTTIQGNLIGVGADGTTPLGNIGDGISLTKTTTGPYSQTLVGGTGAGVGNVIAFNARNGILDDGGAGDTFRGNSIHDNGLVGISLSAANNGIAAPVLSTASSATGSTTIHGGFVGAASASYTVEFFASATNAGQGQRFLGASPVNTDSTGDAIIFITLPVAVSNSEHFITATLTDAGGDTSQFSGPIATSLASGYLAAAFPSGGIWRFSVGSGWVELSTSNAATVAANARGDVVAVIGGAVWR